MRWNSIKDYEEAVDELVNPELGPLAKVFTRHRQDLRQKKEYQKFTDRLKRSWAIETGLLEGVYSLDRGTTETLIEHGLKADILGSHGGKNHADAIAMIRAQEDVLGQLMDLVGERRKLNTSTIKSLHQGLLRNQKYVEAVDPGGRPMKIEPLLGEYKKQPNNPTTQGSGVHEYCPPKQVASEMDRLLELHHSPKHQKAPPEVEAAWLHHRFTQIHPFQDGNGRVARALATLVFLKKDLLPLVISHTAGQRVSYLDALETADRGDLRKLIALFAEIQRNDLLRAIDIAEEVLQEGGKIKEIIQAIARRRRDEERKLQKEQEGVMRIAGQLHEQIVEQMQQTKEMVREELGQWLKEDARLEVDFEKWAEGSQRRHWFHFEIVRVARELGYFANRNIYHAWARLKLPDRKWGHSSIVVSLHGYGQDFRGVLAGTAFFFSRTREEDTLHEGSGHWVSSEPTSLCAACFQVNYKDRPDSARERLDRWLNDVLSTGLVAWDKGR